MSDAAPSLTQSAPWRALVRHAAELRANLPDHGRLADERPPGSDLTLQAGPLFLDYSRHLVDMRALQLLGALVDARDLPGWRARLFAGERINTSEDRAALHTALRDPSREPLFVDGEDVRAAVRGTLAKMREFSTALRAGRVRGATGAALRDVVCIGIGGSDLGPRMVWQALARPGQDGPRMRFVANLDHADLDEALDGLDPAQTLVIVASKSFGTEETLVNAQRARAWLTAALGAGADLRHMAAVTAHPETAAKLGYADDLVFRLWDWVGGRYSLWSAVGLPVALAYGMDTFDELLAGAHDMDEHFRNAEPLRNMPVLLALLGVWCRNFLDMESLAIAPYSHRLGLLPAYLQQLDMESNGKSVDRAGNPVDYATAPLIWGGPGTNTQHSYFQWLHQGTSVAPVDFIAAADAPRDVLAHFLAQGDGLLHGRPGAPVAGAQGNRATLVTALRAFAGNRPSSSIVLDALDARSVGALIALYEHKVFVQGVIWNINSFDQWGVELGKTLAKDYAAVLAPGAHGAVSPLAARLGRGLRPS